MSMSEVINLKLNHQIGYTNDDLNWIGAEDGSSGAQAIRTGSVAAYNAATHKCVRKFGETYSITDITAATVSGGAASAGGNGWTYKFYGKTSGTLIGTLTDQGGALAYVHGAALATSEEVCCIITCIQGTTATMGHPTTLTLTTTTDIGGYNFVFAHEILAFGAVGVTGKIYLSRSGSTYYDTNKMHGGYRHTPTGTERLPYFDITTAVAALGGAFVYCHVLDSAVYDEYYITLGAFTLQAASGCYPTLTWGIGPRVTREMRMVHSNYNTVFVDSVNGNDLFSGTYWSPVRTLTRAYATILGTRLNIAVMNSATYITGTVTNTGAMTIEPLYGYMPVITPNASLGASFPVFGIGNGAFTLTIAGITLWGNGLADYLVSNFAGAGGDYRVEIYDCDIYGARSYGVYVNDLATGTIIRSKIHGQNGGVYLEHGNNAVQIFQHNNFYSLAGPAANCNKVSFGAPGTGTTLTLTYSDNLVANNMLGSGLLIQNNAAFSRALTVNGGSLYSNVFYKCGRGIYITSAESVITMNLRSYYAVLNACTTGIDTMPNFTINYTCYFGNTNNFSGAGATTNNNPIAGDPGFLDATALNFAGAVAGNLYHTNGANNYVGLLRTPININANAASINGLIIDGQNHAHQGILKHAIKTGTTIRYCTIKNCLGMGYDDYGPSATSDTTKWSVFMGNYYGLVMYHGGNTLQESIAYRNTYAGIYNNNNNNIIIHAVMAFNTLYGLYNGTNGPALVLQDSITTGNGGYGVYTAQALKPLFSDINDGGNSYLDLTDVNSLQDNPFFVSEVYGTENFRLRTIEAGYLFNSACKNKASDGYDMGAWEKSRATASEAWNIFTPDDNPRHLDAEVHGKAMQNITSAMGSTYLYGASSKRLFPLNFDAKQYTTANMRKGFEYLSQLIPTRENLKGYEETKIWFLPCPTSHIDTGTAATVSATGKSLTDATKSWTTNEHKGFWVGITFASGTGVLVAATNTLTDGGATWIPNQWAGYYITQSGYWYRILSNTSTVLTLSNPNATLTSNAAFTYTVDYFFEILSNSGTVLILNDPNEKLIAGSKNYYVEFIVCRVNKVDWKSSQPRFDWKSETTKMGYSLTLEQI